MNPETLIKLLEGQGYNVNSLREQMAVRAEELSATADEYDLMYICPSDRPLISEHVWKGEKQVLSPGNAYQGYSYTLSPGQRQWLKDMFNLTPTATVTLSEVALWEGNHPRRIILASDEHVDVRRRHVLSRVVISNPGKFFYDSHKLDQLIEDRKPRRGTVTSTPSRDVAVVHTATAEMNCLTRMKVEIGDEVTIAWSSRTDKATKQTVEEWWVTKSHEYHKPSMGGKSAYAINKSMGRMLDELERLIKEKGL